MLRCKHEMGDENCPICSAPSPGHGNARYGGGEGLACFLVSFPWDLPLSQHIHSRNKVSVPVCQDSDKLRSRVLRVRFGEGPESATYWRQEKAGKEERKHHEKEGITGPKRTRKRKKKEGWPREVAPP